MLARSIVVYVNARTVSGVAIPLPMQTTYIREYCAKKGLKFSLPIAEQGYADIFPVLSKLLLRANLDLIISTGLILPSTKIFNWGGRKLLANKGSVVHLVSERKVMTVPELCQYQQKVSLVSDLHSASLEGIRKYKPYGITWSFN
jgi:sporadic carbohydrate cluster protein (TIGR04323 family)